METKSDKRYINKLIDPYEKFNLDQHNYVNDYLGIDKLGPVSIICGQSVSGKTNVLLNLLKHKLLFEY